MNRLRELREDRDLLQKDIAKEIGLSQRNYSYYETDERKPYTKSIMKMKKNKKEKEVIKN